MKRAGVREKVLREPGEERIMAPGSDRNAFSFINSRMDHGLCSPLKLCNSMVSLAHVFFFHAVFKKGT